MIYDPVYRNYNSYLTPPVESMTNSDFLFFFIITIINFSFTFFQRQSRDVTFKLITWQEKSTLVTKLDIYNGKKTTEMILNSKNGTLSKNIFSAAVLYKDIQRLPFEILIHSLWSTYNELLLLSVEKQVLLLWIEPP